LLLETSPHIVQTPSPGGHEVSIFFLRFFLPLPAYLDICELVEGSHIEGEKTCEPRGYCKHRLDKLQQKNTATYDSKKTFAENKRDF